MEERCDLPEALEERLRFETLLCYLSARFVNLPSPQVDGQIEYALEQIVAFLDVDRSSFGEFCEGTGHLLVTHQYAAPGIPPMARVIVDGILPWLTSTLRRGEAVVLPNVDALPPEAVREREFATEAGIKAHLSIPLSVGGSITYVLAFGAFRSARDWPEGLIARLRLVGEILANALTRKRADEERAELLRFERLLSELSARFVDLAPREVAGNIDGALKEIAEALGADRCALRHYLPDRAEFHAQRSWASEGIQPVAVLKNAQFPYVTGVLLRGECVKFASLKELPAGAETDRHSFAKIGIQSFVGVPLTADGATVGAISLASYRREREWPDPLAQRLRLLGDVLANAMARQRGQEELQRLRDELAHVARIVTLGTIATSIAHEVNQPLCAILSNAQSTARLLSRQQAADDLVREALQDIANDARRASDVVGRIRSLGKRSALRCLPLDLDEVLGEVLPLVRDDLIRRDVSLELALAQTLPPVRGDRVQLQQVILNLILNGAEALEGVETGSRRLRIGTECEKGTVTLRVEDSGPGLDAVTMERVFEAFFTTKAEGMGLGLAISRSIVEAHGGKLWASGNAGPGTTFHLALPAAGEEVAAPCS